uniref:Uncharacterized protein n=1 Tax=Anguilla anguilla TaxID=7936 RepID=A0A0E9QDG5_ANGAN
MININWTTESESCVKH